jgi:hypothetical protein
MKLNYDRVTVRFFLPWKTSVRLGHDISHPDIDAISEVIESAGVEEMEIGSGHSGIYFDVRMECEPAEIPRKIYEVKLAMNSFKLKRRKG